MNRREFIAAVAGVVAAFTSVAWPLLESALASGLGEVRIALTTVTSVDRANTCEAVDRLNDLRLTVDWLDLKQTLDQLEAEDRLLVSGVPA